MKQLVLAAFLFGGALGAAQATVLNFDSLTTPGHHSDNGIIEQGFQFSYNTDAIDVSGTGGFWSTGVGSGHSGKFAALNDQGGDMAMTHVGGGVFSVQDLWLNGWQGGARHSTIQGWLDGQLMGSVDVAFASPWQDVALGFDRIDQLVIADLDNGGILVDDIRVNEVPEPAGLALFGLAAGALALARRRKA